jgi:imidazoleglycerol-phosphate dehydratase
MRVTEIKRETKETQIQLKLNIDGSGQFNGTSGIGFFDHMLHAFAVHGGFDIDLSMKGDLEVDGHHSVEDAGIVLGQAFAQVVDKKQIERFGSFYVPMDEALAFTSLDISGRPFVVFNAQFLQEKVGDYDSCMTEEFVRAFAVNAGLTLHTKLEYGTNAHHCIEAIFKSIAHAMRLAVKQNDSNAVLSTKGVL